MICGTLLLDFHLWVSSSAVIPEHNNDCLPEDPHPCLPPLLLQPQVIKLMISFSSYADWHLWDPKLCSMRLSGRRGECGCVKCGPPNLHMQRQNSPEGLICTIVTKPVTKLWSTFLSVSVRWIFVCDVCTKTWCHSFLWSYMLERLWIELLTDVFFRNEAPRNHSTSLLSTHAAAVRLCADIHKPFYVIYLR